MKEFKNCDYVMPDGTKVRQLIYPQGKTQLAAKTKYSYCPFCSAKLSAEDKKALAPLFAVDLKVVQYVSKDGGEEKKFTSWEHFWECDRCKRQLNEDDFSRFYGDLALKEKKK